MTLEPTRLGLTATEAAQALGVSTAHVYRMVGRGQIPARRLGRRIVIPIIALERLLNT